MTKKNTSTKAKAKAAGAKMPADYKAAEVPFTSIEGHELLIPLSEIRIEDGIGLLAALEPIIENDGDMEIKEIGSIFRAVREGNFIADKAGFEEFTRMNNLKPALELIMAYVGEMSKGLS